MENETNIFPKNRRELTTFLAVNEELGKSLVATARDSIRKRLSDQCVGEVETVLQLIAITEGRLQVEQLRLDILRGRLEAIEKGAVRVVQGNNGMQIMYNDEALNGLLPQYQGAGGVDVQTRIDTTYAGLRGAGGRGPIAG